MEVKCNIGCPFADRADPDSQLYCYLLGRPAPTPDGGCGAVEAGLLTEERLLAEIRRSV